MKMKFLFAAVVALGGVCGGLLSAEEPTAASYVQGGLVHQWDALENVGLGVAHDDAATVWKDLAGNADLACQSGQYVWGANYFQCDVQDDDHSKSGGAKANCAIGDYRTVEVVFRGDGVTTSGRCIFSTGVKARFCWLNGPHQCIQFSESNPSLSFTVENNTGDIALAATYSSNTATAVSAIFQNGRSVATSSYSEPWSQPPEVFTLGFGRQKYYCFTGRIYTIRMYNRELSAEELAANAAVDRARFLGVRPCEVTHVWTGAADADWTNAANWSQPGGAPVATAPDAASVVSVAAGAAPLVLPLDGAEVARLLLTGSGTVNLTHGTLTTAVAELEAGTTIGLAAEAQLRAKTFIRNGVDVSRGTYTGLGANGQRVAWLSGGGACCVAGGQDKAIPYICRGFGAGDYVQNGLIHQWDGLENASRRIHDTDVAVWRDLAGTNNLACMKGQYAWGDSYFYSDVKSGNWSGSANANVPIANYRTVEVVYRANSDSFYKWCLFNSGVQDRFMWMIDNNGVNAIQFAQTKPSVTVDAFTRDTYVAATFASAVATEAKVASGVFLDGAPFTSGAYNETWSSKPTNFTLGFGTSSTSYCFQGRIYAIRMYDRELTAEEIAANAALDRIRFFGGEATATHVWTGAAGSPDWNDARNWRTPSGDAVTAAPSGADSVSIVASAGSSLSIRLPRDGAQALSLAVEGPGAVTFTVTPEFARPWKLSTLKVKHADLSTATSLALDANVVLTGDGIARDGASLARGCYTGTGPRGARVAWLAGAGALNAGDGNGAAPCRIQEYTAENYVQEGLVAAWDGLENAGPGVYDAWAAEWKDLAGSRDLALGPAGSWGEGWLNCAGGIAAQGSEAYGDYLTIEIVYRSTDANQLRQVVFDSGKTYRFAVHNFEFGALQFAYGALAGKLPADETALIRAVATFDSISSSAAPTGVYLDGQPSTTNYSENWATCGKLTIGKCNNDWRLFTGRVYAIRLYNRVLTSREIAKNFEVDSIRFFGAEPPLRKSMIIVVR